MPICCIPQWTLEELANIATCRLLVIPLVTTFDALVENGHRLVCRSDLNLLEKGFIVVAIGTCGHRPIHIFPGLGTTQYIIDHFTSGKSFFGDHCVDGT